MVHGGVHGSWAFENIGPRLAGSGWHGVALNWLNHHGSASLPLDVALQRSILDVGHEIGVVAGGLAQQPVLLAHSMGSLAALAYAAQNPVAGLVLLASVVPREFAGEAIDVPYDESALWLLPPGMAAPLFWDEVPAGHAERYTALMSPESPRAVIEATRWTVELDVNTATAPSLLFGAERDFLVPAASVRRLATALGSDVEILPDQGHGLTLNPVWPVETARIEGWLRQREGVGWGA